jgi:hypothetical protein
MACNYLINQGRLSRRRPALSARGPYSRFHLAGGTAEVATRLEDVTPGAQLTGMIRDAPVTVVQTTWIGANAARLTYRTETCMLDERLLLGQRG